MRALERRLAAAEARAERAEGRLREARHRARLANERAGRARKARDRVIDECGARVRAALDQADAAIRDADSLRAESRHERPSGPVGPGPLAEALRALATARAAGDRPALRSALATVAATAARWRDVL